MLLALFTLFLKHLLFLDYCGAISDFCWQGAYKNIPSEILTDLSLTIEYVSARKQQARLNNLTCRRCLTATALTPAATRNGQNALIPRCENAKLYKHVSLISYGGTYMKTAAIILAAGKPTDTKAPRPLIHIGGKSMLMHEIDMFKAVPVNEIAVVVGYRDSIVKTHIENCGVTIASNRHYNETEMLDSVLLGAEKLKIQADKVLVLPADTPLVSEKTCDALLDVEGAIATIPMYNGASGHPIMLTAQALTMLADYDGTGGMRGFTAMHADEIKHIEVDDPAICMRARGSKFPEELSAYEEMRRTGGKLHASMECCLSMDGAVMNAELSRILNLVETTGSLQLASDCLGISYSKSWKTIKNLEKALGVAVIASTAGGTSGGNSHLTDAGKYFLHQYDELMNDAQKVGKWLYSQYFSDEIIQKIQKLS